MSYEKSINKSMDKLKNLKSSVRNIFLLSVSSLFFLQTANAQKPGQLDYLIKNAWVFDGSGTDSVKTNIGIRGKMIVYIGNNTKDKIKAKKIIDADGLYLSPGFIDPHTHYDRWLSGKSAEQRMNIPCLSQGVTTVFVGNDGFGSYLVDKKLNSYTQNGIGTNVALLVGFGSVRSAVLGSNDVAPDSEQLKEMEKLVAEGMQQGAFGLSTGLFYAPQSYSTTDEVIALAKVAKKYNGVYDTHMRSESNGLVEAVQETLDIGEASGIALMISHIKCLGPSAWGSSDEIINMINDARSKGVNITANQYPYVASSTSLKAMLMPRWAESGGSKAMVKRFENPDTLKKVMIGVRRNLALRGGDSRILISSSGDASMKGKTLHQIALDLNLEPEDAAIHILKKHPSISAVSFSMEESDVLNFMKQSWVMTGSDGGGGHPRTYGSFIKVIREYVLDKKILSMKEAIHRATGQTAEAFGIEGRGLIKMDYFADIVLFDPKTVNDNAIYTAPDLQASGIKYVFVNGELALKDDTPTGILSGEALRHKP